MVVGLVGSRAAFQSSRLAPQRECTRKRLEKRLQPERRVTPPLFTTARWTQVLPRERRCRRINALIYANVAQPDCARGPSCNRTTLSFVHHPPPLFFFFFYPIHAERLCICHWCEGFVLESLFTPFYVVPRLSKVGLLRLFAFFGHCKDSRFHGGDGRMQAGHRLAGKRSSIFMSNRNEQCAYHRNDE